MKFGNIKNITENFSTTKILHFAALLSFVLIMSGIISSQNLFFKSIVENGISKKDIIAQKTITVVDTDKTELRKKEIAQKIDPILTPAEDDFIKNNLATIQNSIFQIRKKEESQNTKLDEISLLFDISDEHDRKFITSYLLKSDEQALQQIFDKTNLVLSNVLSTGITEKDFEKSKLSKIITRNITPNTTKTEMKVIKAMLEQVVVPNLVVDEYATDMARRNAQALIKPYEVTFQKGDKILFEGEPVTRLKRAALIKAGYNVIEVNYKGFFTVFLLVLFGTLIFLKYISIFEKNNINKEQLTVTAFLSIILAIVSAIVPPGFSSYVLPFTAYIMILTIFTSPIVAFFAAAVMLAILTIVMEYSLQFVSSFILINIITILRMTTVKYSRRFDLIRTGLEIGLWAAILIVVVYRLESCLIDIDNMLIIKDATFVFLNGALSGAIALGVIPFLEGVFKFITPYGLAELADHNQPLLKRLQFEAPGTYHHSLMVSNLCEAAAEAVGANPILARVGAFYHDIGKLKRPLFFVENQSYFGIENPHTKLNPRLSKMVITAHPKDGIELAKEYGIPNIIHNFIIQHHGEGLASYFYTQAIAEEGAENVKEEQFRYTGPKPNMKETAILMIADAVESAVRSLKTPTNEEIENIIDKIIVERLNDGQLSDSPLTLKDLKIIATTFNRILRGMQHNRIKYHEDIVHELDKNKINNNFTSKVIDKELDDKIKELEEHTTNLEKTKETKNSENKEENSENENNEKDSEKDNN